MLTKYNHLKEKIFIVDKDRYSKNKTQEKYTLKNEFTVGGIRFY